MINTNLFLLFALSFADALYSQTDRPVSAYQSFHSKGTYKEFVDPFEQSNHSNITDIMDTVIRNAKPTDEYKDVPSQVIRNAKPIDEYKDVPSQVIRN